MVFNRPPRIQKTLPTDDVIIPAPNQITGKPSINWIVTLMPIFSIGLIVIVMSSVSKTGSSSSYYIYLSLMVVSVVASVFTYFQQRKKFDVEVKTEKENYLQILADKKKELAQLYDEQEKALNFRDPSPEICVKWPSDLSYRLGERRPQDPDFLSFRIGLGTLPSTVKVHIPDEKETSEVFYDFYKRAKKIKAQYSALDDVPITINLENVGLLGIAGKTNSNLLVSKSIILQLTSHHWPSEISILVMTEKKNYSNWSWIKEVPHKSDLYPSPIIPLSGWNDKDFEVTTALEQELLIRQEIAQENAEKISKLPAYIVFIENIPNLYEHAAFSRLLEFGPSLRIYGILLSDSYSNLPAECIAYIERDTSTQTLVYRETGEDAISISSIQADNVDDAVISNHIKALSNIEWLIPDLVTEPPSETFGLLDLFPSNNLEEIPIKDYWSSNGGGNFTYLKAPIGKLNPITPLFFDLNDGDDSHGPHGIIGGMTGAGKSVLLKTILLSFALTHHPYDLSFALIDYKGGGDFLELLSLPHIVGFITDIENHEDYAHRVIDALSGELKKREKLIQEAQKKYHLKRAHIDDYRLYVGKEKPMPHLVIIFDEFAEFKERHKEESKKLISIARRGRSLGVHLILCTQNPQASIDEEVKQNARFTISLKVNSVGDSKNLIGIPDAWDLQTGKAFLKVRAPQKFKIAYPKIPYLNGEEDETQAILKKINAVSKELNLDKNPPAKVWPSPLPDNLFLSDILSKEESLIELPELLHQGVPIGLLDNPHEQIQSIYRILGKSQPKNLIVFGGPSSGKSTFLMTVAMSIAHSTNPEDAHIYGLDLGKQNVLNVLDGLPHIAEIGGIISGGESGKINRFLSLMRTEISERILQITSFDEYLETGEYANKKLPLIVILVDGLTRAYLEENPSFEPQMLELVRDGMRVGVYVVITSNSKSDIRKIDNLIEDQFILSPRDRRQILDVISYPIGYFSQMEIESLFPPGRGIFNEQPILATQISLPVKELDGESLRAKLRVEISGIKKQFPVHIPVNVTELPLNLPYENVCLSTSEHKRSLPIGLLEETLAPVDVSIDSFIGFWVASTFPELGKTTFLINFLLSFAEKYSPQELSYIIIDFHSRSLKKLENLPHNQLFVRRPSDLSDVSEILRAEINKRNEALYKEQSDDDIDEESNALKNFPTILVVIDDLLLLLNKDTSNKLAEIVSLFFQSEDLKIKWIFSGNINELASSEKIVKRIGQLGSGILFGGADGLDRFGARIPYGQRLANLPVGRGYFISGGHAQVFQAAKYWVSDQDKNLISRIENIKKTHESKQVESNGSQVDLDIARRIDDGENKVVDEKKENVQPELPQEASGVKEPRINWDKNFSLMHLYKHYEAVPLWNGKAWKAPDNNHSVDPIVGWINTDASGYEWAEPENPVRISKNTLVTGVSGAGKSWFLRVYALSLALLNTPDMAKLYYLDAGGWETFSPYKNLPHIASDGIAPSASTEHISKWLSLIEAEMQTRQKLFEKNKVADYLQYQYKEASSLPFIHILVDNWNWASRSMDQENLRKLVERARTYGMRFIIAAQNHRNISFQIRENLYNRIVLQTTEKTELLSSLDINENDLPSYLAPWRNFSPGEGYLHTWFKIKFKIAYPSISDTLSDDLADKKAHFKKREKTLIDEQEQLDSLIARMKKEWEMAK